MSLYGIWSVCQVMLCCLHDTMALPGQASLRLFFLDYDEKFFNQAPRK